MSDASPVLGPLVGALPEPTMLVAVDGQIIDLVHHNDRFAQHPGPDYFRNWHWYGFTQSQITAVVLVTLGSLWIALGKLWKKDGDDDRTDPARALT